MIKKRLVAEMGDSKKYIYRIVAVQWLAMLFGAAMVFAVGDLLEKLIQGTCERTDVGFAAGASLSAVIVRAICSVLQEKYSYQASAGVKKHLRDKIFRKLIKTGTSYKEKIRTAETVQVTVEGVDQLETYFGAYLPQFFYSMLAPLTLFGLLCIVSLRAAIVLLVCVPLIPGAIVAVQKIAKKLLSKYWGEYAKLGDNFLENLQGMTTLKIYKADERQNRSMNAEAERFRRITMKVLTMQLNSVTIMDLIAYGGAALGTVIALSEFRAGRVGYGGCFTVIMLSAEFFIPMRRLGSYFHVAMNGMAASDRMFRLLDMPDPEPAFGRIDPDRTGIKISDLRFGYEKDREVLHRINIELKKNRLTAITGASGSGKSTIAMILMGRIKNYEGSVKIGGMELSEISEENLMDSLTYVGSSSFFFKGTVRENLRMGKLYCDDREMWAALEKARLADFLREEKGLDTRLSENAAELSGGQRQRLALARALLHDSPVYIFDEATSSIDPDSENEIMDMIYDLAKSRTVLLITHRLMNSAGADRIYVLKDGKLAENGRHHYLLKKGGYYSELWKTQQELENIGKGGRGHEKR